MEDADGKGILYLSEADIAHLAPPPAEIVAALERNLLAARGAAAVPKLSLAIAPGHFFQAMPAAAPALDLALVKWVGVVAASAAQGVPNVQALIVLSRVSDGRPLAVMAGGCVTAWRTAAMTAAVAKRLARADSRTIGFVGVGLQARSHLEALQPFFPRLERALLLGRSALSLAAFRTAIAASGLAPVAAASADTLLAESDIVISSVPAQADLVPFLDGRRLRPGAFAAMVDLGRSWKPETLAALDVVATDERVQSRALAAEGKLAHLGPWAADLIELIDKTHPGRTSPAQRTAFVFAGTGACDLAVAAELYRRALAAGAGTRLPA